MKRTLLLLMLSFALPQEGWAQPGAQQSAEQGRQREQVIAILRALRDPNHGAVDELAVKLAPLVGSQLDLLAEILVTQRVPGIGQEPQALSEVQRGLILQTIRLLDLAKSQVFLAKPTTKTLSRLQAAARMDLLGALGNRAQLDEIIDLASRVWLKGPEPDSESEAALTGDQAAEGARLTRSESETLRRAIASIIARDSGCFDHLKHRWSALAGELKLPILLALGSSSEPKALEVLAIVLREHDTFASAALAQISKLGRHPSPNRNEDLLRLVEPYLGGSSSEASAACQALAALGLMQPIPALIGLLEHQSPQVRNSAHWTLGSLTAQPFPNDPARWKHWYAAERLWMQDASQSAFQELQSNIPNVVNRAADIIKHHPLAFEALDASIERLLSNQDSLIQAVGIRLAAERRSTWALPILIRLFDHTSQEIRDGAYATARALSGRNDPMDSPAWQRWSR